MEKLTNIIEGILFAAGDPVPVDLIKEKEEVEFESLFAGDATVPEIVTTFQALLELLKHQFVIVEQSELFAKITIKKNPNKGEEEEIGEIDEYN